MSDHEELEFGETQDETTETQAPESDGAEKTEESVLNAMNMNELRKKVFDLQQEAALFEQKIDEEILHRGGDKPTPVDKKSTDNRSIYVGNVDYSSTPEELEAHFSSSGVVARVTILNDKFTRQPKGFAYVEFEEQESVANALLLNEMPFKGRLLKISNKRTNLPGMSATKRRFPGARGRGGFPPRGRGRGFGGRGRVPNYYYSPY